ncbi:hypothetical protein P1J78_04145 [Psychromarinibacter sp. C21-152]|uniref:Tail tape measure protein n=1 Tax=Psychromarinibacter sediminicola TaxID=3033385 RepID=A0AAE3NP92_9RHOB|nr:hypothetical protein [Psychromarinibacter sediminicola]MDF0599916.1 hypothetical protein [Psychromarinibacter sediminicola]
MAQVVGDIAVSVGADISPLQRGMRQGSRSVRGFERDSSRAMANFARSATKVTAAITAITAGTVALAGRAAQTAVEVDNLANIAGVGTTEFQRMAEATRTVGIDQQKLSDILKDVNDRIGDFVATGGGPMADFFENIAPLVGVTADEFARLSGPEALQLYVDSLEKAGASQAQMTFYMEALANDATALLPLLRNNGQAMRELGDEAQETGRILDRETIRKARELDETLDDARRTIETSVITALSDLGDEIGTLATWVADTAIPALTDLVTFLGDVASAAGAANRALRILMGLDVKDTSSAKDGGDYPEEVQTRPGEGDPSNTGLFYVDENGNVRSYGEEAEPIPGITTPGNPGTGNKPPSTGRKGGGGRSGPTEEDFERLRENFATEQEIIQENYERQLEQLEEFRNAKLATEEEFNETERRIHAEHQEKMMALERKRRAAMLQDLAGMFGDLASLMQTENKRLFEIGKAAAIAEAVVNGYSAAVAAWAKGMDKGGPPLAAAFTAASLARTGALISSISSQSIGGGGGQAAGGGGGGVGSGAAAAQPTSPRTVYNVSIGNQRPTRQEMIDLISLLNEAQEDGSIIRLV